MASPLWTIEEVAEYLSVGVSTLRRWRANGDGPPGFLVGRNLRFRSDDVEEWVRSKEITPVPLAG